jgi:hypothetical protein
VSPLTDSRDNGSLKVAGNKLQSVRFVAFLNAKRTGGTVTEPGVATDVSADVYAEGPGDIEQGLVAADRVHQKMQK